MKDFMRVLEILLKYANDEINPFHCEHDQLSICAGIESEMLTKDEVLELDKLGVFWSEHEECFISFRFGSC